MDIITELREMQNVIDTLIEKTKEDNAAFSDVSEELEEYRERYLGFTDIYDVINIVQKRLEKFDLKGLNPDQVSEISEIISELDFITGIPQKDYKKLKQVRDSREKLQKRML